MMGSYNKIDVRPVTGALGAEVLDVDLAEQLDNETSNDIYQALLDHLVLFFHDQHLTIEQHKAFARRFGPLHIHPFTVPMEGHPEVIEIIKEPNERRNFGDTWHTDLSVLEEPPLGSIIYAHEVPAYSGDTQWLNMYLAYETLSEGMKKLLDGLVCIHRIDTALYSAYAALDSMKAIDTEPMEAEHPLVRTHPETGRKLLYIHRGFVKGIKGLADKESAAIMNFLYDHAENPDFACRFHWRENDVAFWDNRCTHHRVSADYFYELRQFEPHRRRMHRVTVCGTRPV